MIFGLYTPGIALAILVYLVVYLILLTPRRRAAAQSRRSRLASLSPNPYNKSRIVVDLTHHAPTRQASTAGVDRHEFARP